MSKPCDFAHVIGYGRGDENTSAASPRGGDMTLREFAQTDFEPWDSTQKTFPHTLGVGQRSASTAFRSDARHRPALVEGMASEGMLESLLETLQHAKEGFGHFRDACAAAEARLYVAGHAVVQNMGEDA